MNNRIALTISPKDRLYDEYAYLIHNKIKNPLGIIYKDDKRDIIRALNRSSDDYTIYPELDKSGRLHYHGVVTITNKTNWLRTTIVQLKKLGFVCAKDNPNEGWSKYCTKEWEMTQKVLEIDIPIMYEKLRPGPKRHDKKAQLETTIRKTIQDYLGMQL